MACLSEGLICSILQLSGQQGHRQEMALHIMCIVYPIQIYTGPITEQFRVRGKCNFANNSAKMSLCLFTVSELFSLKVEVGKAVSRNNHYELDN